MSAIRKLVASICLLLGGLAIFVLGNPYYTVFPTNGNQAYYIALIAFFLVASLALRKSRSLSRYRPAAYALFVAAAALLFLSTGLFTIRVHAAEFPGGGVVFGVVVFLLGAVSAYSIFKTDGLLGAVLFHTGYDLMIIVPVLSSP